MKRMIGIDIMREAKKNSLGSECKKLFGGLKRYTGKILRLPLHLAHIGDMHSLARSNANILKNIQYFLILKETCPELAQTLMPQLMLGITPEIKEYIFSGYYSQLTSIKPLKTQYYEVIRDGVLNLLGTAQGRREEFIERCLGLARMENVPIDIYVSLFKEMKMVAASQDVLEELCGCFFDSSLKWNVGKAQLEAWALSLGILAQSPKQDTDLIKKFLTKHKATYKLASLERDLGASWLAKRFGFYSKMISDSAFILEIAEENENNNFFVNYIKGKTVAIVGNGPQELGSGNGKKIDSYDVVIRFNDYVISSEFAVDYGQKTNVWALAARLDPSDPININEIDVIFDPLGIRRFLYPVAKLNSLRRYIKLNKTVIGMPVLFYNNFLERIGFGRPTSGLLMAAYIKHINPHFSSADMYGFSFKEDFVAIGKNQEMIAQHYYDSKPGVKMPHSTLNENNAFKELFSS